MATGRFEITLGLAFLLMFSFFVCLEVKPIELYKPVKEVSSTASTTYIPHEAILITSDEEFESIADDEGWFGDGTSENPFIISGYLLTDPETQPIRIWNTRVHWIFENNIIEGGGLCGCFIVNTTNGVMTNNTFRFRHNGMAFQDVENLLISENSIYNNTAHGLEFLGHSTGVEVRSNRIENNRQSGIHIPEAFHCQIAENEIIDNYNQGISISSGSNVTILNNEIKGHPENGIILGAANCNIIENTVEYSGRYGIALISGSHNQISGNYIIGSTNYGLYLSSPTSNITITENILSRNGDGCQVFDAGCDNNIIFNYYDDWTSPDLNSDGIVDNPYLFDGAAENRDLYPLVSPDTEIPATIPNNSNPSSVTEIPLEFIIEASVIVVGILVSIIFIFKKKS